MKILFTVIILTLTSCAEFDAIRAGIAKHGAEASDQTLDTALWTICKGSPVGAINRRFRTDAEKTAYRAVCPESELP